MNIPTSKQLALGLALVFLYCTSSYAAVNWLSPELEALRQQAQQEDKLILLYFSADWCAPCKWMEQNTFQDPQLSRLISENYLAAKVDINSTDNKVLQHQFEVESIPSILVFATNGQLIDRRSSSQEARPLMRWLRHLDRPAHHTDASLPQEINTEALASPQKNTSFSRPALIPEDPEPAMLSANDQKPQPTYNSPGLVLSGEPLAMADTGFAPRSGAQYSIKLQQVVTDYSTAVRQAAELERKYETRAELQPLTNGHFIILLGNFETTGDAKRFLQFLERNNRQGQVVLMGKK